MEAKHPFLAMWGRKRGREIEREREDRKNFVNFVNQ